MIPLPVDLACPDPMPVPGVTVEVASTGVIHSTWGRVVDSGREGPIDMPLLVGILRTGKGVVLVDSGLGATTRDGTYPPWPIASLYPHEVPPGATVAERLAASAPLLVLLTHTHYDHIGGLLDLPPGTDVWTTEADWAAVASGTIQVPVRRMRGVVDFVPVSLRPGTAARVLGRPGVDVLGDGTIWYLSLPGHTAGAAAVLVRSDDGPWLFVGDTAWVDDHLRDARRPWLSARFADANMPDLDESLAWARWMKSSCPDLRVVAGHEPSWVTEAK